MKKESTIKKDDFWRLINREQFLLTKFNARLKYRIPALNNEVIYVQVICDDKTNGEHAEQYLISYIEPKHSKSIPYQANDRQILCDDQLNRLMQEYLVHIEIEDKTHSHRLIFHSSSLTVLYLAIDDFQKSITNLSQINKSILTDTQSILESLSTNFERELTTVDEQDQIDEQNKLSPIMKNQFMEMNYSDNDDNQQGDDSYGVHARQGPQLKIAYPGAEKNVRKSDLQEFVVNRKKSNSLANKHNHQTKISDINDNDLVREMRQKLKGRNLRDVIIDGANIGRTYGDTEFSALGIKLAVDLFQSYGYPDSKIVVILPAHYLSKDKHNIFHDLIHRKIVHKAFQQKIDDKNKRFYDDRLIVDLAVMRKGVILSNDFYRDLLQDSGGAVRKAIRERLLCYRFIGDNLCLPNPVSEGGLFLDQFLTM